MKRGYDRETYLRLIERVRELLPSATISSDFISGFCGESEEDHADTLSLLEKVHAILPGYLPLISRLLATMLPGYHPLTPSRCSQKCASTRRSCSPTDY